MNTEAKIIVPVDFCPGCMNAFNLALNFAKKQNSKIYILHIISDPQLIDPLYVSDLYEKISFESIKEELEKEIRETYVKNAEGMCEVESQISRGYPASEIVEFAKVIGANLIVMATHARTGLKHAFIGSIAEKVLRSSQCPVLTVKLSQEIKPDKFDIKNILVPMDFSEQSERALELSLKFASLYNARIEILNVIQPISFYPYYYSDFFVKEGISKKIEDDVKVRLDSLVEEKREIYKDINYKIYMGEPFQEILEEVKTIRADLIIMGTHGRTGFSHLLMGSVAERVVRLADCPVMTVK